MHIQKAERKQVKLRLNISSPSGFGKTYGALQIAYGLTSSWETICVIDTENRSASLYSHLGNFNTIPLNPPFTPERYIQAIKICEDAGMEVIIIDSVSHVWNGEGGLLEYQAALGGRYQDWAKATPLYQKWLNTILQSKCHIITTTRKKQAYNLVTENNKTKVEKAGLDDEIRNGYDYEMTLALEIINGQHITKASKDRTQLFTGKPEFKITVNTGVQIKDWCNRGKTDDLAVMINSCQTVKELVNLYNAQLPPMQEQYTQQFNNRKRMLLAASNHFSSSIKPS
ncbi:AAA family ATPase [Niabella aquatica]